MKKIAVLLTLLLAGASAFAQKGNIGFIYPTGAQRGTTVEVTVGGQGLGKVQGIIFSGEGISAEMLQSKNARKTGKRKNKNIGEEDNLQLADQIRFKLIISPNAKLGMRDVRLQMPGGVTNRLFFEIGELPDILESPKESISAVAQTLPVTFNGQITRSDVDRLRFKALKGQNLVIRVKGREFVPYIADAVPGWFQPVVRLYGPDGREVAWSDDYTFHVDPVMFFKVPESGYYDIEINDGLFRGREDFVYRIDVGELPFITSISPIGGPKNKATKVTLRGYNLKTQRINFRPKEKGLNKIVVTNGAGLHSNTVLFDADELETLRPGKKPVVNDDPDKALEMELGQVVEGVISKDLQQKWYSFELEKKSRITLEVMARRAGAPTDIRMTLFDERGNVVKDVDDVEDPDDYMATHFADPTLTMPLNPGYYYVRLIESQAHSGEEYAYRFKLDKARPDFSLRINPSVFSVPEGGTGIFEVFITRKQKFAGEVSVNMKNLPSGFKVSGGAISKGKNSAIVSVTAPTGAQHELVFPKVYGEGMAQQEMIVRQAMPAEKMMQAFYYNHFIPIEDFRMNVVEPLPFTLEAVMPSHPVVRFGSKMPVTVKIHRNANFDKPITLMVKSNAQLKAEAVVVAPDQDEATLELYLKAKKAPKKSFEAEVTISGVVKGTSKKLKGQGRNAFTAAMTAYTPVVSVNVSGR